MASGSAAAADFLVQLATQVIILMLLLGSFQHHELEPSARRGVAAALKLPAFLSSWMPHHHYQQQQQHQQQPQQQQQPLQQQQQADELLNGDYSTNSLAFTGLEPVSVRPTGAAAPKQVVGRNRGQAKRPFTSILPSAISKHPAGHLFASLPKSLFGRILSANSGQQSKMLHHQQHQQLQQQVALTGAKFRLANPSGQILWPHIRPHQQQQQQQQQLQQQQQQQPALSKELVVANYNGQSYRFPAVQLGAGSTQLVSKLMQSAEDLPITSFRPAPVNQNALGGNQHQAGANQQAEKHALGYGEQNDDFVIMNGQQVPELQAQAASSLRQQQQAASNNEDYREMPAILISDNNDILGGSDQPQVQSNSTNLTPSNSQTGANQDLKLGQESSESSQETGELVQVQVVDQHENETNKTESTTPSSSGPNRPTDSVAIDTSDSSRLKPETQPDARAPQAVSAEGRNLTSTPVREFAAAPSLNQTEAARLEPAAIQSTASTDTPDGNRQESAAKAVILPSMEQRPSQPDEALENFILGPYKGLSLGDEVLAPSQMNFHDSQRQPVVSGGGGSGGQSFVGQFQPQQPPARSSATNLLGGASNLVQQARQLIQLPFAHLPGGSHFLQMHHHHHHPHHQQRPSQHLYDYMSASNTRPKAFNNNHHHHNQQQQQQQQRYNRWPSNMAQPNQFLMANQAQSGPNLDFGAFNQNLNPFPMPETVYNFNHAGRSNFDQAYSNQPPRSVFASATAIRHGNPAQAATVQHQQHQQQRLPLEEFGLNSVLPPLGGQRQYQSAASYKQIRLDAPTLQQIDNELHQFLNISELNPGRVFKSGLYQIEPPKFEADSSGGEQGKQSNGNEDDSPGFNGELQQQKVDPQASQEQEEPNNDDNKTGDKADGTRQSQQASGPPISVPVETSSVEARRPSNETGAGSNQVLQVGASFGVAETNSSAPAQRDANMEEARKGQVFNEPLATASQPSGPARPWLDTQVFTLPYSAQGFGNLAAGNFMRPLPMAWNLQQQQQQVPVTFISASSSSSRPEMSSWSKYKKQASPQVRMMTNEASGNSIRAEDEQQQQHQHKIEPAGQIGERLQYFHYQPTRGSEQASSSEPSATANGDERSAPVASSEPTTSSTPVAGSTTKPDEAQNQAEPAKPVQSKQVESEQAQARSPSSFCSGRPAGLYADVEQRCKAYYQCAPTGHQMFRCNNQTQFNQKTQNCDWWYNVDCGGRQGSPEDFEQSSSSQRARIAMVEPTQEGANSAPVSIAPAREDVDQESSTTPMAASAVAAVAAAAAATTTTTTATTTGTSSTSTSSADQQQQRDQSGLCSDTSQGDCGRTGSAQNNSQNQNVTSDEQPTGSSPGLSQQTDSPAQYGTVTIQQQDDNLIEVVGATVEPQPRVGAVPSDETATLTSSGITTTQSSTETTPTTQGGTTSSSIMTTFASKQQRQQQISEQETTTAKSSRRLIQSEFGGSSKSARAVSRARYQEAIELPRIELAVGELSSNEGQFEDQLRRNQNLVREDTSSGQQQQVSATGLSLDSNQFDPHTVNLDGQQELADTNSQNPTRRRGILSGSGFSKIKEKHSDSKIGRRFGARLPPSTTNLATVA